MYQTRRTAFGPLRALTAILALAIITATGSSIPAADGQVPRTVSGTVTFVDGGQAADVVVDLFTGSDGNRSGYLQSTMTGADGRFTFEAGSGGHIVTIIAPAGDAFVGGDRWHQLDVAPDGDVGGLDARLIGAADRGTIEGRVVELDAAPGPTTTIDLFAAQADGSRGRFLGAAVSDDEGRFRFEVWDGCHVLTFIAPGDRRFVGGSRWAQPSVCVTDGGTEDGIDATLAAAEPRDPTDPDPFGGLPFTSGELVAADHVGSDDVLDLWRYVTNGFHEGDGPYDPSADPQIAYIATGGDPLPALDGTVHPGFRRMHTAGPQSLWDARNQPDHTRSQLGGWGRSSNFHLSGQGEREFIVYSVRLDPDSPVEGSVLRHTGLYYLSMVSQFKSVLPGSSNPMIAVYEGRDGLQFVVRENGVNHYVNVTDVPRGVWLRIGLDVLWSSDDGAYRWWVDLDGDDVRDFEPLGERRTTATILPEYEAAAANIGPYHTLEVPRNGRDYGTFEILRHPVDDPWG